MQQPSEVDPQLLSDACGENPSWACQQVLDWTDGNESLARTADFLLAKPLQILIIVVAAWLASRVLRRAIQRFVQRIGTKEAVLARLAHDQTAKLRALARAETIAQVLRSVATATVYAVAGLLVLGELGINLGPLLAGAGIAGIAIGFGAQSLVKDFLSGIFMLVEDQYGVGDIVDVGEAIGTVEAVTLRSTKIRDLEGALWHVPNGNIVRVANHSQQWARAVLDVNVTYETDLEHAKEVILRAAEELRQDPQYGHLFLDTPEIWGVEALGADGAAVRLVVKTKPSEQWGLRRVLRERIKNAFAAEGIEFPYPQRTVWFRGEGYQPGRRRVPADAEPFSPPEPG